MESLFSGVPGQIIMKEESGGPDFYIHQLFPIDFFGNTVYITSTHICTVIIMIVLMVLAIAMRRSFFKAEKSGRMTTLSTITEMLVDMLTGFVETSLGKKGAVHYINYIGVLLLYIFFSNISGIFGLRPPTADYGTTLALALITFVMIQYANIRYQKFGAIKALFEPFPLFLPMNIISEFSTPLSMSLRLFGNVLAGTVLMALYYGMLPWFAKIGVPAALHVYFDIFSGAIQAYVFGMLTITFISDKRGITD